MIRRTKDKSKREMFMGVKIHAKFCECAERVAEVVQSIVLTVAIWWPLSLSLPMQET
jgi:hypothetical protein